MSWNSFKNLAQERLSQSGLCPKVQSALVLEQANNIIKVFFGQEAYNQARAVYYKDGVLTMAILSDSLFNEIETQKLEFLTILNSKFEEKLVDDLRFLN